MGNFHLLLSICFIVYAVLSASGQVPQLRLSIGNVSNCSTNASIPFSQSTNYTVTRNGTLAYSVNGLWIIDLPAPNRRYEVLNHNINSCRSLNTNVTSNGTVVRVTRIGDSNMASNKLLLFASATLVGTPLEISGNQTSITQNVNAAVIQGTTRWTIYTAANYTGSSTCVSPSSDVASRGWGITRLSHTGTVRSVRSGCTTLPVNSTTPPPGNSSSTTRRTSGSVQNKFSVPFLFLACSIMFSYL